MLEDRLVAVAQRVIARSLARRFEVERGAPLLYQVKVDNRLAIRVNPLAPTRGQSAFETDVCVFERTAANVRIPRVVLEFKAAVTTHDILTYSAKARKHKQIYPYLRYGLVAAREGSVPGKFFTHNEALDFLLAARDLSKARLGTVLCALVKKELATSRRLEAVAFGSVRPTLYRTEVSLVTY